MARVLETIEQAIQNAVAQDRRRILRGLRKLAPQCSKHRSYKAVRKPISNCEACWVMWFAKQAITIVEGKR